MNRKIDRGIALKFAAATGVLMTRVFSTPLETNARGAMFAAGPATSKSIRAISSQPPMLDVVGLGFVPGREWKGPKTIFIEEMRDGELRTWHECRLWAGEYDGPLYLVTEDPDLCFSFDGVFLVPLLGRPQDLQAGARRAMERLRAAARLIPDDVEMHTMH